MLVAKHTNVPSYSLKPGVFANTTGNDPTAISQRPFVRKQESLGHHAALAHSLVI